jgi:CYTH domain-containing protein/CHAD domain-containing protein
VEEIERKFLLRRAPHWLGERAGVPIAQGYLVVAGELEVRVRRAGEQRTLTVKRGHGRVREEIEVAIDRGQFDTLWQLTGRRRLRKTRRPVDLGGGLSAEVDVFEDELDGLVLAEVEFPSEGAAEGFEPPGWMGEDVTGDTRFAGQTLAARGMPQLPGGASRRYELKRSEPVAGGVGRIALGCAEKALDQLGAARDGDDPAKAVHSARKELKKLRSVLRLIRAGMDPETYERESRRFRDAGRLLSASRDAEVKAETLAAIGGPELEFGAGRLERDTVAEGAAAVEAGAEAIASWHLYAKGWKLVGPGVVRTYGRGRRAFRHVAAEPSAAEVHEWRKRVKDLWYQLKVLGGVWPAMVGEAADQAHRLADLLGEHHDLAVLDDDLSARDALPRRGWVEARIHERQRELLGEALELGALLYAERPKAFGRRLEAYWAAWRG